MFLKISSDFITQWLCKMFTEKKMPPLGVKDGI